MRAARRRLAQVRQRIRRLSWMARDPDNLHPDVPLLSLPAFLRALARFQTIRMEREQACVIVLRLQPCDLALRRAAAMYLLENTRNCDTLGCTGSDTFLLLLKGADKNGARAATQRLHAGLRQLAALQGQLLHVHITVLPVHQHLHPRDILPLLSSTGNAVPVKTPPMQDIPMPAANIVRL